jgi:hypothetical protein
MRRIQNEETWKRAQWTIGRVLTGRGGDRTNAQSALCIKDPRRRSIGVFFKF